jgi:hypothetical protein
VLQQVRPLRPFMEGVILILIIRQPSLAALGLHDEIIS